MKQQDWIKNGQMIEGTYYGVPYKGIIEQTRVCYGGDVQYHVRLLDMVNMGTEIDHDWRSTILVKMKQDIGTYTILG